jgi:hypothetical protein
MENSIIAVAVGNSALMAAAPTVVPSSSLLHRAPAVKISGIAARSRSLPGALLMAWP